MKLVLVRHGESEANLHTYYTGQMDVDLTEKGVQQAGNILPILRSFKFDKVYCSDLKRTVQTCANALPDAQCEYTKLLREYDVGTLQGINYTDIVRVQSEDLTVRPDYTHYNGENAEIVRGRARQFLEMLEKSDYECVAAFTHFGFIGCLLQVMLGVYFDVSVVRTGNCAIHILSYDGEKWRIEALNYMKPIDDSGSMKHLPAGIMPL